MYLVAIMDWYSRFVIVWQLSNTLDDTFCMDTLRVAIQQGKPDIFNTDQGSQFTANVYVAELEGAGVQVSMDGRGKAFDNVFVEGLWRNVKYENIYIKDYATVPNLSNGLIAYSQLYNYERPHQSLDYQTPTQVYSGGRQKFSLPLNPHLNFVDS